MSFKYFSLLQVDDVTVARLVECQLLDNAVAHAMADELLEYVTDAQPHNLVVDFSSVGVFRDILSWGLLRVFKTLRSHNGELVLAGMNENVREVVEILSIDRVFHIYDSVEDAIRVLRERS